ncbi:hypothetical protein [Paenibacillus sp. FSL L8-0708]|uniref:hypothetical protein n=1 Tax=Paenibacillus sp. FSL L8-0708 TaxID=2975311 RepID=UPI0030F58408
MKPIDQCDSCAHLSVELTNHKAVRVSYLAENERLRAESRAHEMRADEWAARALIFYEALREIDTHIRATSVPIPHIVATLKRVLPEYAEESGDPFADEEVSADDTTQESAS